MTTSPLAVRLKKLGERITNQRLSICRVLEEAEDHPDADTVYLRARDIDPTVSVSCVYRTLKTLVELGLIASHYFGDGKARFEIVTEDHHDHLIDLNTGKIIEFQDNELEELKQRIAARFGYRIEFHKLQLYCTPDGH